MKRRFDMIIFDLDGTLVDTFSDVSKGINHAVRKMGRAELDESAVKSAIGPGGDDFLRAVLPDGDKSDENIFLEYFRSYYDEHCLDSTRPFLGIPQIFDKFSGCTLTVATNKPIRHAGRILTGLDLMDFFSAVQTPDNGVKEKPHPEMVLSLVEKFNVKKERTLLVGDTVKDLEAGKNAGVKVCGARYGYGDIESISEFMPDFMIDSPSELVNVVLESSN